ncbi:gephyrin-like molybdotransferase receptor GlpR [Corynebacterium sp.]|uniref:divisome protein SepX/GlpR n=1 Tax=Corynebacterium sp. TaxID=1720 RepID=UPI0026DAB9D7|nr:gephyrin-like molybdotransferase receptor GlpR [Corynebacterium sp.]MDO5033033.1 hypothetical protein [Corynebacterium sp.]
MSVAVPIILIIVVWLFVLAPWLLRSQRPMSHTGEAFDDTRVLFEGDSGSVQGRRRPHLRGAAATVQSEQDHETEDEAAPHAQDTQAKREVVDADAEAGRVPGSDSIPTVLGSAEEERTNNAERAEVAETIDGEVVSESFVDVEDAQGGADAESAPPAKAAAQDSEEDDSEDDEILIEDEPARAQSEDAATDADSAQRAEGTDADGETEGYDGEVFSAPVVSAVAEDAYELDESYTSPVDLMYPGAVDSAVVDSAENEADADADAEGAASAEDTEESFADEAAASEDMSTDLSEEDVAFAQRRLGRGGWDPVADKAASATRYQRRQRTLLALAAAVVVTVALGIVVGGWTWWLAAIAGVLSVVYLVALRSQVRAEQELLRRRVYHLRRARLGVRNGEDTAADLPRNLRRPGAVILELDDDSPDFDYLPLHYGDDEYDGFDGPHAGRGPRRDDLAARRVS